MLAARVSAVRQRIAGAAARAGRDPADVRLVAVSKTHPAGAVREAFASAGLREFGENRVQEAEGKAASVADLAGIRWHLVGHLQANKARKAAALFDCIHSVDSIDLAVRLDRAAAEQGRTIDLLVQVDPAVQPTKFGLPEAELMAVLEQAAPLRAARVVGLMGFPPFADDPETVRGYFRRVRELRDEAHARGLLPGGELSMGMTQDLEVAIEEGATLVRVGTAIFGGREAKA